MVDIKNILYPTDFSQHSLVALPFTLDLAGRYEATLHCLHVVDSSHEVFLDAGCVSFMTASYPIDVVELCRSAEEQFDTFLREHVPATVSAVKKTVEPGKPFVEIIRYCRRVNIDLIVLGTHGHSALASMLLGSVAEKVVRKAPCAVLTVRHPEHRFKAL